MSEDGRKAMKELIAEVRKEAKPVAEFIIEEFGDDLNSLFDTVQDAIVAKTTRGFNAYRANGFSRDESIALVTSNTNALVAEARNKR